MTPEGDIIGEKQGAKSRVEGDLDYKDNIAIHNHPDGVAPYPSTTDFETFQSTGAREMIVVSKEYTVRVRKDSNTYQWGNLGRDIRNDARMRERKNDVTFERNAGKINASERNLRMRTIAFEELPRIMKEHGYIMAVEKR